MKTLRNRIASLLAAVLCLTLIAAPAGAYVRVDTAQPVSLSLTYQDGDTPVTGMEVSIYKVYDMSDAVRFTPTTAFADAYGPTVGEDGSLVTGEFQFDIYADQWAVTDADGNKLENQVNWTAMATSLESLLRRDQADPEAAAPQPLLTVETDEKGVAAFSSREATEDTPAVSMTAGLYLVMGEPLVNGRYTYTPQTFLVSLPHVNDDDSLTYDLSAMGKMSSDYDPPSGGSTISITVNKIWDDAEAEDVQRPASVTVQLLRNGNVYETRVLNEGNGWKYHWNGLSASSQWQIAEVDVPEDYTVMVERENNTFIVTNTATTDIDDPNTPLGPGEDGDPGDGGDGTPVDPGDPGDGGEFDIPEEGVPQGGLPDTGVHWLPVQILTVVGILCFSVGWIESRREKNSR